MVKKEDWNDLEILCEGDHIQIKLNGMVTADIHDSLARRHHRPAIAHGPAMEARFRNIAIRELR